MGKRLMSHVILPTIFLLATGGTAIAQGVPDTDGNDRAPATRRSDATVTTAPAPPDEHREFFTGDWLGTRTRLADRGITVGAILWLDAGVNLRGGRDTSGSGVNHLFSLNVTLDADALLGIKGGSAYIDFQNEHGDSVTQEVGDFQYVSGLYADGFTQITETWYRQELFEGLLVAKAGKIEILYDLAFADAAWDFNNGSIGYPLSSLVMPTYPHPAFGVDAKLNGERFFVAGGIFDGALAEGYETGKLGPSTFFGEPSDLYLIAEGGYQRKATADHLATRIRLGVWHHTGRFSRFTGGDQRGATGSYAILEQQLWRERPQTEDNDQGLAAFAEIDFSDGDVIDVDVYASAGVVWTGAIDGRDQDVAGLGVTWAHFTHDAGYADDAELAVETFYKIELEPWLSIKPDLQYVGNPAPQVCATPWWR
jgi:porin